MARRTVSIPIWAVFWFILIPVSLLTRSYLPIDETRYVSVAWDMWLHGDFLVPHLNGEIYSEKPPLLFWLYHLGWAMFGVGDIWPRIVSPLFGAASLFLTAKLARRLWPERPAAAQTAPLIAMGCSLWMIFMSAAMFDMLMVFFTLAGVMGIIRSWQDRDFKGWLILGGGNRAGDPCKRPGHTAAYAPPGTAGAMVDHRQPACAVAALVCRDRIRGGHGRSHRTGMGSPRGAGRWRAVFSSHFLGPVRREDGEVLCP